MLYCNLIFVYLMLEEGSGCTHAPRKRWLAPLLVAAGIVQTVCYFLFPAVYAVFMTSYLSVIVWLVWRSVRLARPSTGCPGPSVLISHTHSLANQPLTRLCVFFIVRRRYEKAPRVYFRPIWSSGPFSGPLIWSNRPFTSVRHRIGARRV